ncbi:DUF5008 domain-containing protein [Paraflavitalea speifideaquila]|uniref:DUF5008 domain-containing protein n=1 Tax=Paraflavitalea speifideaquila TaxID=3076558 RepID=UPI0028E787D0|nr:DUF5008 domain-containing protein [Paraflavitalea speifideiaquila]
MQLYPDGPKAPIKFLDGLPAPSQGRAGTIVTFKVMGLKGKESKFKFLIGQLETEVITVGDSTISVRIPADAITGGAAVEFDNQYFFGPEFRVRGNLIIDPSFVAFNGARGQYLILWMPAMWPVPTSLPVLSPITMAWPAPLLRSLILPRLIKRARLPPPIKCSPARVPRGRYLLAHPIGQR